MLRPVRFSEIGAQRDLSSAGAPKIGSDAATHDTEIGRTQVCIRIAQIGVVQDVCERALSPQPESLRDSE